MHLADTMVASTAHCLGTPTVLEFSEPMSRAEFRDVMEFLPLGRRHDAIVVVRSSRGRFAAIRKPTYPPGAWRFPGGGVDRGETLVDGAARELREECGLPLSPTRYLARATVTFVIDGAPLTWVTHAFACDSDDETELQPTDHGEAIAQAEWVDAGAVAAGNALFRGTGRAALNYRGRLQDALLPLLRPNPSHSNPTGPHR